MTSSDPCWRGGTTTFSTTAGNEFWVTFMTNSSKPKDDPSLNFTIYAVADEAMTIIVADANGNQLGTIDIPAGAEPEFFMRGGIRSLKNL